jgi:hypothetical protein
LILPSDKIKSPKTGEIEFFFTMQIQAFVIFIILLKDYREDAEAAPEAGKRKVKKSINLFASPRLCG